jgi:peptidoglycan hydrolase CwlO-like protein
MKKTMITLMVLALVLTACAGMRSTSSTTAAPTQDALPASTQLILGTFRLEGTAHAVSAGQAAELLPLWQVYQDLEGSGTAAQEEIDALVGQIQETLSESQMQAI